MKRRTQFIWLGLAVAIAAIVGVLVRGALSLARTYSECMAVVEAVVPKVCGTWDVQALQPFAAPSLRTPAELAKADALFRECRGRLGAMSSFSNPRLFVNTSATTQGGVQTIGECTLDLQCAKGRAELYLRLARIAGAWRIDGFRVMFDLATTTAPVDESA